MICQLNCLNLKHFQLCRKSRYWKGYSGSVRCFTRMAAVNEIFLIDSAGNREHYCLKTLLIRCQVFKTLKKRKMQVLCHWHTQNNVCMCESWTTVYQLWYFLQHPKLKRTLGSLIYKCDLFWPPEQCTYGWNGIKCCLSSSSSLPVMMSVISITAEKQKERGFKHSHCLQTVAWL